MDDDVFYSLGDWDDCVKAAYSIDGAPAVEVVGYFNDVDETYKDGKLIQASISFKCPRKHGLKKGGELVIDGTAYKVVSALNKRLDTHCELAVSDVIQW